MILPNKHEIPAELYDKYYGQWMYEDEGNTMRCKICGSEVVYLGDDYGGIVRCKESGEMLFDY